MSAPLKSRPPTGLPAVPIIVVHGVPKSGRTVATVKLSTASWVDRYFVLQLNTQAYDDYGAYYPRMEILEHDGTISSITDQVEAACAVRAEDGKLNVVVIDDATELWDMLKMLAETRQRRNKKTQDALKIDPDAEIDPTRDKWNDVKARWTRLFLLMKRAGVVGVWVCRGGDVSDTDDNGQPLIVKGKAVMIYRIQAEKSTSAQATMIVRIEDDHSAYLESVTSIRPDLIQSLVNSKNNRRPLGDDNPLGEAIEIVRGTEGWSAGSNMVASQGAALSTRAGQFWVVDTIRQRAPSVAEDPEGLKHVARAMWDRLWRERTPPGEEMTDEHVAWMQARIPEFIDDTLLVPWSSTSNTPPPAAAATPVEPLPLTEPDVIEEGAAADVCPVGNHPRHTGPCPT